MAGNIENFPPRPTYVVCVCAHVRVRERLAGEVSTTVNYVHVCETCHRLLRRGQYIYCRHKGLSDHNGMCREG